MTKQEFERRMEAARLAVIRHPQDGLCYKLAREFRECRSKVLVAFNHFKPKPYIYFRSRFWLHYNHKENQGDKMTQLERRLVFLESFKGFCEAYKLYESW